jgi:hypothetical protein
MTPIPQIWGSTPVSGVGFGVSPKQSFFSINPQLSTRGTPAMRFCFLNPNASHPASI